MTEGRQQDEAVRFVAIVLAEGSAYFLGEAGELVQVMMRSDGIVEVPAPGHRKDGDICEVDWAAGFENSSEAEPVRDLQRRLAAIPGNLGAAGARSEIAAALPADAPECTNCGRRGGLLDRDHAESGCLLATLVDASLGRGELDPPIAEAEIGDLDWDIWYEVGGPAVDWLERIVREQRGDEA